MGLLIIYLLIPKKETAVSPPNVQEIVRDSIIRDSIYIVNDSIVEKIKYIDKEYDEKYLLLCLVLIASICAFLRIHRPLQ